MSIESAQQSALKENFKRDIEKFCKKLCNELNKIVPRDNIFELKWEEKESAFNLDLQDRSMNIWMGPRVIFSKNRVNKEIFSVLVNVSSKSIWTPEKGRDPKKQKEIFFGDYAVSDEEHYNPEELKKVEEKMRAEILAAIENYFIS